jgi:hypothetical protein
MGYIGLLRKPDVLLDLLRCGIRFPLYNYLTAVNPSRQELEQIFPLLSNGLWYPSSYVSKLSLGWRYDRWALLRWLMTLKQFNRKTEAVNAVERLPGVLQYFGALKPESFQGIMTTLSRVLPYLEGPLLSTILGIRDRHTGDTLLEFLLRNNAKDIIQALFSKHPLNLFRAVPKPLSKPVVEHICLSTMRSIVVQLHAKVELRDDVLVLRYLFNQAGTSFFSTVMTFRDPRLDNGTLLHYAIRKDDVALTKFLLSLPDIDLCLIDDNERVPFHFASRRMLLQLLENRKEAPQLRELLQSDIEACSRLVDEIAREDYIDGVLSLLMHEDLFPKKALPMRIR